MGQVQEPAGLLEGLSRLDGDAPVEVLGVEEGAQVIGAEGPREGVEAVLRDPSVLCRVVVPEVLVGVDPHGRHPTTPGPRPESPAAIAQRFEHRAPTGRSADRRPRQIEAPGGVNW